MTNQLYGGCKPKIHLIIRQDWGSNRYPFFVHINADCQCCSNSTAWIFHTNLLAFQYTIICFVCFHPTIVLKHNLPTPHDQHLRVQCYSFQNQKACMKKTTLPGRTEFTVHRHRPHPLIFFTFQSLLPWTTPLAVEGVVQGWCNYILCMPRGWAKHGWNSWYLSKSPV